MSLEVRDGEAPEIAALSGSRAPGSAGGSAGGYLPRFDVVARLTRTRVAERVEQRLRDSKSK
jgi:hypothetical protein